MKIIYKYNSYTKALVKGKGGFGMKDLVDYIKYHGYITSIRDNVDKNYIWFDICQKELYKDKNGEDKNNLSFFSARM